MSTTNVRGINTGTMAGGVENLIVDSGTYNNVLLPAGAMIRNVYIRKTGTLTANIVLKIGLAGDSEYIVPAAANLTTDLLNANEYLVYYPVGVKAAPVATSEVVISPSGNCGGSLELFIRYEVWADLS